MGKMDPRIFIEKWKLDFPQDIAHISEMLIKVFLFLHSTARCFHRFLFSMELGDPEFLTYCISKTHIACGKGRVHSVCHICISFTIDNIYTIIEGSAIARIRLLSFWFPCTFLFFFHPSTNFTMQQLFTNHKGVTRIGQIVVAEPQKLVLFLQAFMQSCARVLPARIGLLFNAVH